MIKAIEIGSISDNYRNKYNNKMLYLSNLNKINIFIGENNSGKSRLLRYIIKGNDTKAFYEFINEDKKKSYDRAKREMINCIERYNISATKKIVIPDYMSKLDDCNYYCEIVEYIESLKIDQASLNPNQRSYYSNIKSYLNEMYEYLAKNNNGYGSKKVCDFDITYIPILRGVESFDIYFQPSKSEDLDSIVMNEKQRKALEEYKLNAKHIYSNKISKAYMINSKHIFTAENLFDDVKNKLLGEEKDRNLIKDFENFISKEFYGDKGFTIIPQITKGFLNVKIGNGSERALHDLGDGIKQLITILYIIFTKRNSEAIFFIEEPEINLHPGYQRQFLQLIQNNKYFSKHQFFITTHSNHFIDNCINYDNISIYKFNNIEKKNNLFKVTNTTNNDIEILDILGVYNSSVFVSNCTIWVEGISDKILISKYLDVYIKNKGELSYKEDINYSFVEYGGNNIDHWSFEGSDKIDNINASGITNRCFIVCDNDNDGKQKRKQNLKEVFGDDNFYELSVREIENTISRQVLEKTLFSGKEPEYIKKYKDEAYATKSAYMGTFIDNHYKLNKKYSNKSGTTGKGSGTIKEKLSFAKSVSSNINDINDLSNNAKELCEKIYEFIKKANS